MQRLRSRISIIPGCNIVAANYAVEKKMTHIKPISSFTDKKDIEIVKYSDKAYAIFGSDTIKIKEKLLELGCRFNKFLTDPNTGQKRAGWIFSNNKLKQVEDLLK